MMVSEFKTSGKCVAKIGINLSSSRGKVLFDRKEKR